jgi:hypothetical protein
MSTCPGRATQLLAIQHDGKNIDACGLRQVDNAEQTLGQLMNPVTVRLRNTTPISGTFVTCRRGPSFVRCA